MGVLAFIVCGLIVGVAARAFMPRRRGMGFVATALFGLAGSFVGALVGSLIHGRKVFELHSAGTIAGVLAVFFVLFLLGVGASARRRGTL